MIHMSSPLLCLATSAFEKVWDMAVKCNRIGSGMIESESLRGEQ